MMSQFQAGLWTARARSQCVALKAALKAMCSVTHFFYTNLRSTYRGRLGGIRYLVRSSLTFELILIKRLITILREKLGKEESRADADVLRTKEMDIIEVTKGHIPPDAVCVGENINGMVMW